MTEQIISANEKEFLSFVEKSNHLKQIFNERFHQNLKRYVEILTDWNKKMNLVSENDMKRIWTRHLLDSLMPLELIQEIPEKKKVIDVGTGAGFPGMVWSIVLSELQFTLVESIRKKCDFLIDIKNKLNLINLQIINSRSEDLIKDKNHFRSYDLSLARAVAKPGTAIELLMPFVKLGGKSVFWASGHEWNDKENLNSVCKKLHAGIFDEKKYVLPVDEKRIERKITIIEKMP